MNAEIVEADVHVLAPFSIRAQIKECNRHPIPGQDFSKNIGLVLIVGNQKGRAAGVILIDGNQALAKQCFPIYFVQISDIRADDQRGT